MRSLLTIARAELLRRIRSRSAIIVSFIGPLAMAVVFGFIFDGTASSSFTIGIVDEAGTAVSGQVVDGVLNFDEADAVEPDDAEASASVELLAVADRAAAEEGVDDDAYGAAIVVGDELALTVITSPSSPLSGQVASSIAESIATSVQTGGAPSQQLVELPLGGRELSAQAYFGASMAILLLFFATGLAAQSILEDRENRTLDRILAGPTTTWSVLIGKVVAVSTLAVGGFVTVWIVTSVVFGATWGNPVGVFVLIVFTVFALAGVATFVGGLAGTAQQATTLTAVVTFGLSLLGGNFSAPADAPAALAAVRGFTPNGRALEAFTELSVDAGSVGSIATALVVLFGFGVVFGAVGLARIEQTVSAR